MSGSRPAAHENRFRALIVLLYVVVLASSAFFHHDFACRQDSRTHCIACTVSQAAQKSDSGGAPLDAIHRFAGRIELRALVSVDSPALVSISDRAPPA